MKAKKSAVGLYSDNETSRSIRIGISKAMPSATTITNAYRKAKENDPTIQYRMTVSERISTITKESQETQGTIKHSLR